MRRSLDKNTAATIKNTEASKDEAKRAAETKATELQAAEAKRLNDLVAIRNPAMSGAVGGGGSAADALRARGFNVLGSGGGGGGLPTAQGGSATGVPSSVPMTADERNKLGLILKYESGGRNVMNGTGAGQGLDPNTAKGATAQGYYQILNTNWRRLAPKLGINTTNAMSSSLEDQTKVALALMRENPNRAGGGIQNWSNYNPKLRAALARGEQAPVGGVPNVAPGGDGASTAQVGAGKSVPYMRGSIAMEGKQYQFGSGGHRGANSIPAGVYPITPDAIGPWGRQNNAIGINGNRIYDQTLGRMREGIELHSASSASMMSAGCLAIMKQQYAQFRAHTLDFVKRNGRAWLKVDSNGQASITAERPDDPVAKAQGEAKKTTDAAKTLNTAPTAGKDLGSLDVAPKPQAQGGVLQMPVAPAAPKNITSGVPSGPGARRGGSAGGGPVNVHIASVNGGSPEKNGEQVGKHVREALNTHYGDISPWGVG